MYEMVVVEGKGGGTIGRLSWQSGCGYARMVRIIGDWK